MGGEEEGLGDDEEEERGSHRDRKLEGLGSSGNRSVSRRFWLYLRPRMNDPKASRRPQPPLMDALGQLCTEGKQLADYLWQVPGDEAARQKILGLLGQGPAESPNPRPRGVPSVLRGLRPPAT